LNFDFFIKSFIKKSKQRNQIKQQNRVNQGKTDRREKNEKKKKKKKKKKILKKKKKKKK